MSYIPDMLENRDSIRKIIMGYLVTGPASSSGIITGPP